MNTIKAATILSFLAASQALAMPAAQSSVHQCNPAHSYPEGVTCDATARTLIYPSATPAIEARQTDPCQDTYNSCIAAGTPKVACSCALNACLGEDTARIRDFCASATANLAQATSTATSTGYACNPAHSYPNGATCISTAGTLALVTPSPTA